MSDDRELHVNSAMCLNGRLPSLKLKSDSYERIYPPQSGSVHSYSNDLLLEKQSYF